MFYNPRLRHTLYRYSVGHLSERGIHLKFFRNLYRYFYAAAALFLALICLTDVAAYNSNFQEGYDPVISSENGEQTVLPIIMYHSLLKDKKYQGKYVISPEKFESDLVYLKQNGYTTVTVEDLINHFEKGTPLPKKPVMLTFDDGYYNNYLYAYPLLKKYDAKAVISIIGYYTEKFSESGDESANYSHITWDEITEMTSSGHVEIQNHSYNLHSIKNGRKGAKKTVGETKEQYKARLTEDLSKVQTLLTENCNITPTAFTYPFGAISADSVETVREMGFKASFTCLQKINIITSEEDLFLLNRYLRSEESSEKFFKSLGLEKYYGEEEKE